MMRISIQRYFIPISLSLVILLGGCTPRSARFAAVAPVPELDDRRPVPVPGSTRYIRMDYYYKVLVRRPAARIFHFEPSAAARDVNSHDNIPQSSWYTPRLGYRSLSPEEMLLGPQETGPPVAPVRVVRAKHLGNNPGFVIADSRDRLYLIKFDPPGHPAIETSTALIVNRLFWAFGYNVPEDYLYFLDSRELQIDPTADISRDDVELVFSRVALPTNGIYRTTASLLIDGIYLGPIPDTGVREDDPNDFFNHEDLRILRALKVFGAFTNQTDIRIDNSLDVYVGRGGEGYVKHYLLDFGEAFGGHAASHQRLWDGYTHIFSFTEFAQNLVELGLVVDGWERVLEMPWKSVGAFEADYFDPATWKETYPYEPIQRAQIDDCYWAAKVLTALTRRHLDLLIQAACYPEVKAGEYILKTLWERRRKILDFYFHQVTPLEYEQILEDTLVLTDMRRKAELLSGKADYEARFYDDGKKLLAPALALESAEDNITIVIPRDLREKKTPYLRLEMRLVINGEQPPRPAEFHLRPGANGRWMVAGIRH